MTKTGWRSLLLVCLFSTTMAATAFALPSFSDQNISKGNLNPTDVEIVQEIDVTTAASQAITLTSATVQNLGTAGSGQIDKIEILDGNPLGYTDDISGLVSGITINLHGYAIPASSTRTLKVRVTVGETVNGGETVRLRVKLYYQIDGTSYTSSWITDGTGETIRNGGFDVISDTPQPATNFDPLDQGTVQVSFFNDSGANSNNIFWTQTGSSTILTVENLGTATTDDIDKVRVTLAIGDTEYTTGLITWAPASPMPFTYAQFTGLPLFIPNNTSMTVKVEMKMKGTANVTDGRTIRTRVTVYVTEGDMPYEQSITANTTQTIRNQGFEAIADESTPPPSGVAERDKSLQQTVNVTDKDVNSYAVTINGIYIRNTGTATGAELSKITVAAGGTTLTTITGAALDNLQSGITVAPTAGTKPVPNNESQTITISYEIGTPVNGHTLQPVVKVRGNENTTDYWSDEVTYPDSVALYQPGFEIVENITPPEGGTAYSSQRLLAQKIHLVDRDENDDNVTINPVVVKNIGSAQVNPDIIKIEVWRKDSSGGEELKLGEATDLAGLRTSGVTIPILQDNIIIDKPTGSETFLYIYVTIAGPEDMIAGRTLQLQTRVLHTETSASYDKMAASNQWTLAINHRPTCDFDYTPTANLTYETEITFTAKNVSDVDGDGIAAHRWEFSDGGTGTGTSTKHTFAAGGSVWAKLTVEDARGLTGSKQKTFDVTTPPVVPVAKFSWDPNTPGVGNEVEFTDTSTTPTGTTITGWDWDFGDDEDSDEQNPKHTYSAGGTYTVSLTVTNSDTQTHTITHDIEVSALIPTADFDYSPATPDVGDTVTFTDKSTAADPATITGWNWNFGDGQTATVKNPTHTFDTMGTYTVTLTVTDSNEETSNVHSEQIVVGPPVMMYSYPNPAASTATIAYRVPDGSTDLMLRVYNITGALVFEQALIAGASPYVWDLNSTAGTAQPNGLYLCVVVAKDASGRTIRSPIFKLLIAR